MLFKFLQDPHVVKLFDILESNSIEARFVGGIVRDELLYTVKPSPDYDLAAAYDIQDLSSILEQNGIHCITTNIAYKTIIAIIDNTKFEITELREDKMCDGRACETVSTGDFSMDAMRRDFTINALYLDRNGQVYDYCGAIENGDLQNRLIRFIGDPEQRIREDYLRILRYYRFCAIYNDVSCMYGTVISATKHGIRNLSAERILSELSKILQAQYCLTTMKQMYDDGIFEEILCSIKKDILDRVEQNDWLRLSVDAKLYMLFGASGISEVKPSRKTQKYMNLLEASMNDNLEYIYYKYGIDVAIDVAILKKYMTESMEFYRITPQDCGIEPINFSKKLERCERWYVARGYDASLSECIDFIRKLP